MASGGQSDALKSALRSGAEIGIARAVSEDPSGSRLRHYISARLSNLDALDLQYLSDLADSILRAGEYVSGLDPNEEPDPQQIPTNPDLFGDESEGKRLFWFGEWNIPGTDEWYRFSGTLPDVTDYSGILEYAAELASSYIDAYPSKFQDPSGGSPESVTVRILGTEKAF